MPRKKITEPEAIPIADENIEITSETESSETEKIIPAEQPAASDADINDLLGSMDDEQEDEPTGDNNETDPEKFLAISDFDDPAENDNPEEPFSENPLNTEPDDSENTGENISEAPSSASFAKQARSPARKRIVTTPVLTIESKAEVQSQKDIEEAAWHEIRNAYRTRKILTGSLDGVEQTEMGKTIALVNYNNFRVVIPIKEMMINPGRSPSGTEYADMILRQNKILGNMLGADIDFIVKGIESKTRSIVASRKDAMLKKRQIFYMNTDSAGMFRIYEGRVVQARVIAVAEKVIRIEAFGVECSIMAQDLSWDWLGDAHERFSVGDQILVRILSVKRNSVEEITIKADIKSISDSTNHDNLKKCRIQSKYAGKVTDIRRGVVFIRLANGANAIAHSCYDRRTPGKKDDVSFAVTHIDEEQGVAVGIITRIIKQNL